MAGFEDIRRGLAANLAVLADDFQVFPYLLDSPTPPALQIAGIKEIEYDIEFQGANGYQATGDQITVVIEACLHREPDVSTQKTLDALHAADGLKHAVEADDRLTSRMNDDQTVDISQPPACDALRVTKYNGSAPLTLRDGTEVLLATWDVEVLT